MKEAFIVAHLHDRAFAAEKWAQRLREIADEASLTLDRFTTSTSCPSWGSV